MPSSQVEQLAGEPLEHVNVDERIGEDDQAAVGRACVGRSETDIIIIIIIITIIIMRPMDVAAEQACGIGP